MTLQESEIYDQGYRKGRDAERIRWRDIMARMARYGDVPRRPWRRSRRRPKALGALSHG